MFLAIVGAEAANMALRGLTLGGVYIAGGIFPKVRNIPAWQQPPTSAGGLWVGGALAVWAATLAAGGGVGCCRPTGAGGGFAGRGRAGQGRAGEAPPCTRNGGRSPQPA